MSRVALPRKLEFPRTLWETSGENAQREQAERACRCSLEHSGVWSLLRSLLAAFSCSCSASHWPEGPSGQGRTRAHRGGCSALYVAVILRVSLKMGFPEVRSVRLTRLKDKIHNTQRSRTWRSCGKGKNMSEIYCILN